MATLTSRYVEAVAGTGARIACTRKTTPGLRALEKYAVRMGGGVNHRFGLYDGVLIKDNHIAAAGGIGNALRALGARAGHMVRIEVEVDNLDQLKEALRFPIDAVLLDNMDVPTLKKAVAMVGWPRDHGGLGRSAAGDRAQNRGDRNRPDLSRCAYSFGEKVRLVAGVGAALEDTSETAGVAVGIASVAVPVVAGCAEASTT